MRRTSLILSSLVLLGGCLSPQPPITSKVLLALAQKPKAEGKRSITTGVGEIDFMGSESLRDFLQKTSIAIVIPTGTPRVLVDGDWIMTAQDLRVERWLRRVQPDPRACKRAWPGVTNDEQLMTTSLSTGTVTVDGVSITNISQSKVDLGAGQRFLFLAQQCPGRRLEGTYWSDSFLVVTEKGEIALPSFNQRPMPFATEIVDLGTVTALENMIRSQS
jgi:hypothetical protein